MKYLLTIIGLFNLVAFSLAAQTNELSATVPVALPPAASVNLWGLFSAWFMTVINNPASVMLIGDIIVGACLLDSFKWYPCDRVMHACAIVGASTYWLFAFPSTVPPCFPHPSAVFISNGFVCGFTAFIIHRQAVARAIRFFRGHLAPEGNQA